MTAFTDAARAACAAMRPLFEPTPLQLNDYLSEMYDARIYLKREDLSPVRSYKIRGAVTAMSNRLASDPEQRNFVCASAGNHAQGFAFACRHFGVTGEVFMPITTPQQKIDKTRAFGGEFVKIRLTGDYFDQTLQAAQDHCAAIGAYFLSPFDDPDVIIGQASVAVEIEAEMDTPPDMVLLPVGGGGLSAGVTRYFNETGADISFRYIEPLGGASLTVALANGKPTKLAHVDTFVDGAAVAQIGKHTFEVLKHVDPGHVLLAPENRICGTMIRLLNVEGIVLEPAGALVIDALDELADEIKDKTVVCVTSGGNFDFERLPEVKERAQRYAGLKKYLILRMPQRPGALKDFLALLGPDDDIARFEYLKKSARNFGSVLIGIETKDPDAFARLFQAMTEGGFEHRDITNDEVLAEFLI
ncbi:threonine ammonia-lyase IlvA [Litoreibacter arenae]|uniref:L-threonine dehydratase n=1 Tax=Litoreibacter arenae DSM 19593 TaxID=1123360 RepID=S9RHA0_9RHOB|nr:threonine ammonia-lyase IlvA [Litoreibacter arenae]EPX77465.1 Threonine dehydratase [Litoreibacter arenae DSM 19593]